MAKPRKQACSGREDGAPIWSMGLVVGTGNGVGFVPLLKIVPPSYLLFARMAVGSSCQGEHLLLAKISP